MTVKRELHRLVEVLDESHTKQQLHTVVDELNEEQTRELLTRLQGLDGCESKRWGFWV